MRAAMGAGRLIAGRYRLQDPIGRGAMGVVWLGRDELLHRDVAVKEVMVTTGQSPGDSRRTIGEASYQRTLREARAAARLSHPGVVTVFDVLEESGSPWIVMELIRGRSLDQVIAEDGPLPPRQAARVGGSLLSALAAAHAAGVLHRDVKPANVLVTTDGRVVLSDFGIAKIGADPNQTQLGMVVGTPGFTAPERVRGEAATPASDLWSLGATLYAAVEGRGPFERPGGVTAICAGIAAEEPPRAPSAGSLGPVIDALLRRDPGSRPDAATTATLLADAVGDPAAGPAPGWPAGRPAGYWSELGPAGGDARRDRALTDTAALPAGPRPAGDPAAGSMPPGSMPPGSIPAQAAFLAPPAFDQLAMPGPSLLPGDPAAPGSREAALPAFLDPATGHRPPGLPPPGYLPPGYPPPTGHPSAGLPAPRSGSWPQQPPPYRPGPPPGRPRRGYWRLAAVGASIAAIVVAALLGLNIYNRSLTTAEPGTSPTSPAPTGLAGAAAQAAGQAAGTAGSDQGSTAGLGSAPAGYTWHAVTAARLGTVAGFAIAVPQRWQARVQGQSVVLVPAGGGASIEVSLAPFATAQPAEQARQEQAAAIADGQYPGYRRIAIDPAQFHGSAAAIWRFTWRSAPAVRTTVVTVLVTLPTAAGAQPYALSVSAPSVYFPVIRGEFDTALGTFRTLPG